MESGALKNLSDNLEENMAEQEGDGMVRIPLDGTYGAGPDAELVIVTKAENGQQREAAYSVPYLCLDMARIQRLCDMNFILGFRVVKSEAKSAGLKELGL